MIPITITKAEYIWAASAGIIRQQQSMFLNRQRSGDFGDHAQSGYDSHAIGAVGEFVASLALGVAWRGPGEFRGDDIAGCQVRATHHIDGRLPVTKSDPDEARFILVCGGPFTWIVHGWIYGRDAKREDFWRADSKRPAYFVPQSELIDDFSFLKGEVNGQI